MNQGRLYNEMLRWTLMATATVSLLACQKAKMSSVPQKPPAPYTPPIRVVPPPPGVVPVVNVPPKTPPYTPPTTTTPPIPTVPPRVPPPTTTTPPVVTTPTTPGTTPTGPTPVSPQVPVTTNPTTPVTPTTPTTPTTPQVPTTPTTPTTTIITTNVPLNNAGVPTAGAVPVTSGSASGPNSGTILVGKPYGEAPVFSGPVRVINPLPPGALHVCNKGECNEPAKPYTPDCKNPVGKPECNVQAIIVPKQEDKAIMCPPIEVRTRPYTDKLDILFIVDTSDSMKQERPEIARQMTNFMNELTKGVDYRAAVILAHGPDSTAAKVGELYQPDGMNGVILMKLQTPEQSAAALAKLLTNVPEDKSDVQGEAGLLNLYTAVTDAEKVKAMQSKDFWREDAAKAIVFVADENDVCFDYAELNKGRDLKDIIKARAAKPTPGDLYGRDKHEIASFESPRVCAASMKDGSRLTPEGVFEAVEKSSKMPVAYTGVLYIDNKNLPTASNDKWKLDNEMGRGYLDVISKGHGLAADKPLRAADLASPEFGKALGKLGAYANATMKFDTVVPMIDVLDVHDIDPLTVSVSVIDSVSGQKYIFSKKDIVLEPDYEKNKANVVIYWEAVRDCYKAGCVSPTANYIVWYSTKSGKMDTLASQREKDAKAAAIKAAAIVTPDVDGSEHTAAPPANAPAADGSKTTAEPATADGSYDWKIKRYKIQDGKAVETDPMIIHVTPTNPFKDAGA